MNRVRFLPKIVLAASFVLALAFITSCAPSAAQQAILDTPSVEDVSGLKNKLYWLKNNAQSGGNYVLEVNANETFDEFLFSTGNLSFKNKNNITITLKGVGGNRTISNSYLYGVFYVDSGVTLILDDNITLRGEKKIDNRKGSAVVSVSSGGTLVMNNGATITGNGVYTFSDGGGVSVSGGGTFIMNGGIITGNECFLLSNDPKLATMLRSEATSKAMVSAVVSKTGGQTDAIEGKANNLTKYIPKGCGVYVKDKIEGGRSLFAKSSPAGNFIKTGGTITGYDSDKENGNVVKGFDGQGISQNYGHAVYAGGKSIDITVGPEVQLSFKDGVFSGDWEVKEEAKIVANTNAENTSVCGNMPYIPEAQGCCGNQVYSLQVQICQDDKIHHKCGDKAYNSATHYCRTTDGTTYSCGNRPYNPQIQLCQDNTIKMCDSAKLQERNLKVQSVYRECLQTTQDAKKCMENYMAQLQESCADL